MKKIIDAILQPLKTIISNDYTEKLNNLVKKRPLFLIILSIIITLIIAFFVYILPRI